MKIGSTTWETSVAFTARQIQKAKRTYKKTTICATPTSTPSLKFFLKSSINSTIKKNTTNMRSWPGNFKVHARLFSCLTTRPYTELMRRLTGIAKEQKYPGKA